MLPKGDIRGLWLDWIRVGFDDGGKLCSHGVFDLIDIKSYLDRLKSGKKRLWGERKGGEEHQRPRHEDARAHDPRSRLKNHK